MKMNETHNSCEKTEPVLYRIGMFAAMNRVSVKTLRFYEEQGLISPTKIDEETGYRYYTLDKMALIHQIQALKTAGFTLDEIMNLRSCDDEESVILKKKSELLTKVAELTAQIAILDGYLAKKRPCLLAPVLIKTLPECKVAYMKTKLTSYDSLFEKMPLMGELMESAGCVCALPEYCFTNYLEAVEKEEVEVELCEAVTEIKEELGELKFKTMPGLKVASIFHKGTYGTLMSSYEVLFKYIEENGYKISGSIRESYIDGVWNKENESEWLTEIQVPVI